MSSSQNETPGSDSNNSQPKISTQSDQREEGRVQGGHPRSDARAYRRSARKKLPNEAKNPQQIRTLTTRLRSVRQALSHSRRMTPALKKRPGALLEVAVFAGLTS